MQTRKRNSIEKTGVVVSDKMNKSRVVMVQRISQHPVYKKRIKTRSRFMAHDADNVSKTGDTVLIQQIRRLSAQKRWRIVRILREATGQTPQPQE